MTATLVLTGDQIVSLFKQLDPQEKRNVLYMLGETPVQRREARMATAESRLMRLALARGLDWHNMSDEERQDFVDDLVHEER